MAGAAPRAAALLALGASLVGCGMPLPSPSPSVAGLLAVRVHVADPTIPGVDMELHVGDAAWSVIPVADNAVAIVYGNSPTPVRLYALADCRPLLAFEAEPDASYDITFDANGGARVDGGPRASGTAVEMGPGMVPRRSPSCRSG